MEKVLGRRYTTVVHWVALLLVHLCSSDVTQTISVHVKTMSHFL